jgi:hypothetical protein
MEKGKIFDLLLKTELKQIRKWTFRKATTLMISLPALELFLYVTKLTTSTGSKSAKGKPIASWLQQSNQHRPI